MGVIFIGNASVPKLPKQPKQKKHLRKAAALPVSLDEPGKLRICHLQELFGVSHVTIYKRISRGELPPADSYDRPNYPLGRQGRPYWLTETMRPYANKK
jgi:hypothetical protein